MTRLIGAAVIALSLAGCGTAASVAVPEATTATAAMADETLLRSVATALQADPAALKQAQFGKLDADGDGTLTLDEFKARPGAKAKAPESLTDQEKAELEALRAEKEAKLSEAEAAFKTKYPALAARKEAAKAAAEEKRAGQEAQRAEAAAKDFAAQDANGDGKLSPEEFNPKAPPAKGGFHGPRPFPKHR